MRTNNNEIDIFDLFIELVMKWKKIIIFMLIFALLFGGLAIYKNNKPIEATDEQIENAKIGMTDEEITQVEDSANLILTYRESYEKQKDYVDNSIYQNLNAYKIPTVTLTYYVDNNFQVTYPVVQKSNNIISIIQTYVTLLSKDDLFLKFQKQIDPSIDTKYYAELLKVDTVDQGNGIFIIKYYYNDFDKLEDISKVVKDYVEYLYDDISDDYDDFTITLTSETIQYTVDYDMSNDQGSNLDKINSIKDTIKKIENSYYDEQLYLLQLLVHEELVEEESVLKQAIIGAILGAIAVCAYYVIKYLFSTSVKNARGISHIFGDDVDVLIVERKIDNKLTLLKLKNDTQYIVSLEEIIKRIDFYFKEKNYKSLAIINTFSDDALMAELKKNLNSDIKAVFVNNIANNISEVERIAKCDSAVIIEKIGVSKEKDITTEKCICSELNIDILEVIAEY